MSAMMERPRIDMKAVELAAQSPDPRVRGVALHRLEIEKEIGPLDSFLSFYCAEAAIVPVAVLAAARKPVPARVNGKPIKGMAAPKGKTVRMVEAAKEVIVASGRPMRLSALFEAMRRDYPDLCLSSADSMRARLAEHKDLLVNVDSRGYWPKDTEVPSPDA